MYGPIIAKHAHPIEVQPTGTEPVLATLDGIRAVMFDIYGTLLISGSGDIGTAAATNRGDALAEALEETGIAFKGDPEDGIGDLKTVIGIHHDRLRATGIEYPEVRIGEVWMDVCAMWRHNRQLDQMPDEWQVSRLAIEYEMRVNPVWPMPGVRATCDGLRERGKVLGVISNAQSFTPRLLTSVGGELEGVASLRDLGIAHDLQVFSFELRFAKPGLRMYEEAAQALDERGIGREQTLYVGNDLLNDVMPAHEIGFRTALFAGDRRSLRLREGDDRVAGVEPDLVITELPQILECV